jgi:hypothetical protein
MAKKQSKYRCRWCNKALANRKQTYCNAQCERNHIRDRQRTMRGRE